MRFFSKFIFWYTTLHISGSFRAHHQELTTVQSTLAHFMQVWRPLACSCKQAVINSTDKGKTAWEELYVTLDFKKYFVVYDIQY